MFAKLIFLCCVIIFDSWIAYGWDIDDVSYLLPLPISINDPSALTPSTSGEEGPLISQEILAALPPAFPADKLKVVSVRIDPCFPSLNISHPEQCRAQIRMVWQPIEWSSSHPIAIDSALHTFYELTQPEFRELLKLLSDAKNAFGVPTDQLPLEIHPALSKQGASGPFGQALRSALLKFAGTNRISRATFILEVIPSAYWVLGGFDISNGKLQPVSIPRESASLQNFNNSTSGSDQFLGGIAPEPKGKDTFNYILSNSSLLDGRNEFLLRWSATSAFRIENPRIFNTEQVDCASCHTAGLVRSWEIRHFPQFNLNSNSQKFVSHFNLANTTPVLDSTFIVKALGYYKSEPAINQRAINDSAWIAEILNHLYPTH